jgi:hypothetical protein
VNTPKKNARVELVYKRQKWIAELEAGKDPFTPEVLEELMSE